jgi:hypothetical protein
MLTAVEDTVEIDRVELPASGDCRYILIKPCDECDMARPGLGGHTGMRYSECAVLENAGSEEWSKGARGEVVIGLWVWLGVQLEGLVCAEPVS